MLQGFKAFILRGNVVDLAVAVVIGAAFGAIVTALVKDLITPLIAAIFGKPDFSALTFEVNNSKFLYGDFINAVVSFLLIASAIYFFVIVPMQHLLPKPLEAAAPAVKDCPECLTSIPAAAKRCSACTAVVALDGATGLVR